jgi:insulysin
MQNPKNTNHCLEYIVSIGSIPNRPLRAELLLLSHIAEEPCFNTLRTEEQLGNTVTLGARIYVTVGTWRILVQSERDCQYLEERCAALLVKFEENLRVMTNAIFEEQENAWKE